MYNIEIETYRQGKRHIPFGVQAFGGKKDFKTTYELKVDIFYQFLTVLIIF